MRSKFSFFLLAICLAGCTTGAVSFINQVLADVKSVCSAVIDDSTGAVEQLVSTFPFGTSALAIADTVCTAIIAAQPLPTPAGQAAIRAGAAAAPTGSVVVNNIVIHYAR